MTTVLDTTSSDTTTAESAAMPAVAGDAASQTAQAESQAANNQSEPAQAAEQPAPLAYQDFQLPEGYAVDDQLLGEFKTTLAGLNLNQQQAQLLADLGVKQAQSILAKAQQQQQADHANWLEAFNIGENSVKAADFKQPDFIRAQAENWLNQVKADAELGGEHFAENMAVAAKAVKALVSPQLKELFNKSGLGNHPELIRAFFKAGTLLADDKAVSAENKPAARGRTRHQQQANVLYGQ